MRRTPEDARLRPEVGDRWCDLEGWWLDVVLVEQERICARDWAGDTIRMHPQSWAARSGGVYQPAAAWASGVSPTERIRVRMATEGLRAAEILDTASTLLRGVAGITTPSILAAREISEAIDHIELAIADLAGGGTPEDCADVGGAE